ncbi:MAG TPA: alpha/beta hydrolase [Bryobacteraceae bacterium]|nr:alpha/beta hydrolase [Bryobacteraceae bacterium]
MVAILPDHCRRTGILDLPNILRGTLFSTYSMWDEISALNLMKSAPALDVPVFFFIGRHDHVIAPETSRAYFDMLTAPSKQWVWFEESAHEPAAEEPARFHEAMAAVARRHAFLTAFAPGAGQE